MVHGEGGVEHLVLVQQGHRVEGVGCKQEPRVLQHRCLGEAGGAAGVDVQHRVVVVRCLGHDCCWERSQLLRKDRDVGQVGGIDGIEFHRCLRQ